MKTVNRLLSHFFTNEDGAAMIEFALMLPLFVIFLLFSITCYEVMNARIDLQKDIYSGMREAIVDAGGDDFTLVMGDGERWIKIPEPIARLTDHWYIHLKKDMVSYGGSCMGTQRSEYRRDPYRDI